MRKPILALVVVSLAALAAGFFWWQQHASNTPALSAAPEGGDFTLMSANGPVSLHDFKGKVVLLYFGYTYCPDICPTTLGNLSLAWRKLTPEQRKKVQILLVSVDPKRDTPERLKQYVDFFEANIIGLTGDPNTLAEIAKRYGVVYKFTPLKNSRVDYLVDHSAFTYVIDPNGKLVMQLPHGVSADKIIRTILPLLPASK